VPRSHLAWEDLLVPMGDFTDHEILPHSILPGTPGYRTRDHQSGLDPLDTSTEAARMEGKFYRALFTGRLRTRNPISLLFMLVGAMLLLPLPLLAAYGLLTSPDLLPTGIAVVLLGVILLFGSFGVALLPNFVLSLSRPTPTRQARARPTPSRGPRKRRLPNRRKDYH